MSASNQLIVACDEIQTNLYNKFFNPNICHVCKTASDDNFITCDQCYMITYCSEQHKEFHRTQHMQICTVIRSFLRVDEGWDTRQLSREEWIMLRQEYLSLIKEELRCELLMYEEQMIVFAKSCLICRQQANLSACAMCHSANYCDVHVELFQRCHITNCKELLLSLNLKITSLNGFKPWTKFVALSEKNIPVVDMETFLKEYMEASSEVDDDRADIFDMYCAPVWRLLMHLICETDNLRVVLIGMELKERYRSFVINVATERPERRNQKLIIESCRMLYHDYVCSTLYKIPNIIIGFRMDLTQEDLWLGIILMLRSQNCPLLLTTACKLKTEQNVSKLKEVLVSSE
ncbi:PREDICTED: uncharacterized protein LOC106748971 [Dinoponera quadriceps]|uniref:Uncharacterized protein LOC106748971 n=1 Tax=Dinoponera quadriceps TaxID=609295 RepID=A0A6P3XXX9_DINQU|nr:PREDICTED: uncharacterized protein LOC106748971 [Dinoponera quadriceps]